MAGSIAKLVVTLGANVAGFETDMARATRSQKKRMKDMEDAASRFGREMTLAFTAAAAGIGAFIKSSANVADEMQKLAQRTGISTEALSQYQHVAELSGVSFESFTGGIKRMQRALSDADVGLSTQVRAFDRLGLSVDTLLKMSPDAQFEEIAEALSKMENATLKSATAQEIFGRAGVDLLSVMAEGKIGIREMREEADRFGLTIGQDFADNAAEFNDNMERMGALARGFGLQVTSAVLPTLIEFSEELLENGNFMEKAKGFAEGLVVALEALAKVVRFVADNVELLSSAFAGLLTYRYLTPFLIGLGGAAGATAFAFGALVAGAIIAGEKLRDYANISGPAAEANSELAAAINSVTDAWTASAQAAEIVAKQTEIRQRWIDAEIEKTKALDELHKKRAFGQKSIAELAALGYKSEAAEAAKLTEVINEANAEQEKALKLLGGLSEQLDNLTKPTAKAGEAMESFGDSVKDANDRLKKIKDTIDEANVILSIQVEQPKKAAKSYAAMEKAADKATETLKGYIEELEEADEAQQAFEKSLQDVLDSLYPLEAEGRRLGDTLALLTRANQDGTLSWDQYQDAVNRAVAAFDGVAAGVDKAAGGIDRMQIAIDESVRILERTFTELFDGIIDGSFDAWGAIESGFKSLMSSLQQQASRGITIQIQEAFSKGGGGFSDLKLNGQFGQDLLASIGSIVGLGAADSLFGQIGSTLGNIFGEAVFSKIGTSLFPQLLGALGSWAGPIGTALGAILGSFLGDMVGGLFERDLAFSLGGENNRTRGDNQQIRTPLGDILGLSGRGGFGSLNDPSTFGGQIAKALIEFDTQIEKLLQAVGVDDSTFNQVTDALDNWRGSFGEGADAVDVLASRFSAILGAFSGDVQQFVRGAQDLEEQVERFGIALSVENLIKANPEFFAGKTAGEVLRVVEAFQDGAETMAQAYDQFAQVANAVIGITTALRDFAGSDLAADFNAMLNPESLEQALANVNMALMDAIANFDGSIDSLETIGQLSLVVREGELKLLAQIDSIQKGINANLDKLKADILGITQGDKTGEQLFLDAQKLIGQITDQSSAADIAAIEQQFNSIIRSISPEDQGFMQSEILALIETLRGRANEALASQRDSVLGNAESVRDVVDVFLSEIGDPLDIIARSLEGQNLPEVMDEGLESINQSVQQIGPQVAAALAAGLSQVSFTINLDPGLVTQ